MTHMTVLYYTSNGDYEHLEDAVRHTILRHSHGLPIVSVSHKPIDFGMNICVGQIAKCRSHVFMQLRIAAELATTPFVAVCEADTLYPPRFFQFRSKRRDTYYFPRNGYITWHSNHRHNYYGKSLKQLTGIVGRDVLLRLLDELQQWEDDDSSKWLLNYMARNVRTRTVNLGPVVTLKTDRGMHSRSPFMRHSKTKYLPVWGSALAVWDEYLGE